MKKVFEHIWETAKIVILALAIVIPVRYFLIQPFFVSGASMEPNFENGQYLVINEIGYRFESPQRGDVIVFKYPFNPKQYFIKRIIGLPNETVEIKDGRIFIYNDQNQDGFFLDESVYSPDEIKNNGIARYILEENDYFVLGDNRDASSDSRNWGLLNKKYIIGKVWLRAWPFNVAEVF
ncbi:MAG: signal peptidase I [bacterium]